MNYRTLPFFEKVTIFLLLRILTNSGTEYCDKVEYYSYEIYLETKNIDRARTKTNSSQANKN